MVKFIDLSRIYDRYKEEVHEAVFSCFKHHRWILGPELEAFEEEVKAYLRSKYALGVASGTSALVLALRALSIVRFGKEFFSSNELIVTTPFTFVATGEAILRAGGRPLFVDVEDRSLNLSPVALERAIERYGGNIVGVVVVHLYGKPCDLSAIYEICSDHGLFLVEDCAQAFGATWNGRMVGTFGDVSSFSFFPTKNLPGIGDGGMVVTNDPELYEVLLKLRNHGGKDKYKIEHIGYNARLDTVQASVLRVYLRHISELLESRRWVAERYSRSFSQLDKSLLLPEQKDHSFNLYTIQVSNGRREDLIGYMKERRVGWGVYYPVLLNEMEPIKKRSLSMPTPVAERAKNEVLSLPCFPFMSEEEVEEVIKVVSERLLQP